jgi:hypothetical protein
MATCIHGWGSDGMTPSGCPQCAEMGRQRDKEELARLRDHLGSALEVIESFRPLAHAAKAIADDGWPDFPARGTLPASLEARLDTLRAAYEGIADMASDADAEARKSGASTK